MLELTPLMLLGTDPADAFGSGMLELTPLMLSTPLMLLHADGMVEVPLQRNKFGHYVTSGEIIGLPVTFVLDTGATGVPIPAEVARRLGLQHGRAFSTQTANGVSVSYAVNLD